MQILVGDMILCICAGGMLERGLIPCMVLVEF